jgi:hypothetical protein
MLYSITYNNNDNVFCFFIIPLIPKRRGFDNLEFDYELCKIWPKIISIKNITCLGKKCLNVNMPNK